MMLKRFGVLGEDGSPPAELQREGGEKLLSVPPVEAGWGAGCSCWLRGGLGDGFLVTCCSPDVFLHC